MLWLSHCQDSKWFADHINFIRLLASYYLWKNFTFENKKEKPICIPYSLCGSSHVIEPKWTNNSEQEGRRQAQERECIRGRMNLMHCGRELWQNRHLFEHRPLVGGRTQQQLSTLLNHPMPPSQPETSWMQKGGLGDKDWKQHTSPMPPSIWFLEYSLDFSSFVLYPSVSVFPPDTHTVSSWLIWRNIHASG